MTLARETITPNRLRGNLESIQKGLVTHQNEQFKSLMGTKPTKIECIDRPKKVKGRRRRLVRHPAGLRLAVGRNSLRLAAGWDGRPLSTGRKPCGWLYETLAIVASGFLANIRSLS